MREKLLSLLIETAHLPYDRQADYLLANGVVVDIVKCKECVNSREMDKYEEKLYVSGCVGCTLHSRSYHSVIMDGDGFCSYGERKEK